MTPLRARTLRLAAPPVLHELAGADTFVWVREGNGFVALGEAARFDPGAGPDRFERAAAALHELFRGADVHDGVQRPGSGPLAFCSFTFDPDAPGSRVVVPRVVVGRSGDEAWVTIVEAADDARDDAPPATMPAPADDEATFIRAVERARAGIRAGWIAKVVLARAVTVDADRPFDVASVVRRLAESYPSCFTFAFDGLVGASPELLIRRMGTTAEAVVLAGTAPRGATADEDAWIGAALAASPKERSEHEFAVGTARDVLELACHELKVDAEPWLLRLANVQHLATSLRGELAEPLSALQLAGRLHPNGAVCGVPVTDALGIIRRTEPFDRGRYAGPIGWVDARGDGEIAIALRCAEIAGASARLFAGAGIVADSDPGAELAETNIKLRAMQNAMGLA